MPTLRINGVDLHYEITGDAGQPLVLVHGSWGDHHNWDGVVPGLARFFRVVTYDRRGHSRSERPPGQGSVREDVIDLDGLIERLEIRPAHVAGNSFGASIALRLAGERPGSINRLMVHEPPLLRILDNQPDHRPTLLEVTRRLAAVVDRLRAGDNAGGAQLFVETVAFGPGAWERLPGPTRDTFIANAPTWLDETQDPDALTIELASLAAFRRPALLTYGTDSPPFFLPILATVARALPAASMHSFPGAGHVPHLTHPADYIDAIRRFCQRDDKEAI